MTKGEFLYNIRNNLTMLPKEEVEGIIEDYSMHINELLDEGESLEDILAKLGDPKDIAKQYIEELGYEDKKEEVEVPNIVGNTVEEAKKKLKEVGLEIDLNVEEKIDEKQVKIKEQLPKAGIKIYKGTKVIVSI